MAVDFHAEEEVARGGGEFGIYEAAAKKTQRVPIHAVDEMARKVGLEKGAGVVGVRKGRLDQLVVGLVKRTLWPGHGWECCKQPSWRQREEYNGFDKLPARDARGRFGKIMDSKIIFLEGWARCRARHFSNVDEVLRAGLQDTKSRAGCLATGSSWRMSLESRGRFFPGIVLCSLIPQGRCFATRRFNDSEVVSPSWSVSPAGIYAASGVPMLWKVASAGRTERLQKSPKPSPDSRSREYRLMTGRSISTAPSIVVLGDMRRLRRVPL